VNAEAARFIATVQWGSLEDAYGPASQVPSLLKETVDAKGRKLHQGLFNLCSHVLHQGTIYSASPPATHVVLAAIPDTAPRERTLFYELLLEFAESARMAVEDGPAPPCCAGGDPRDGAAIRTELSNASGRFQADLSHHDPVIRAQAAQLLLSFGRVDAATATLVAGRYLAEEDPMARHRMLSGITRGRESFEDWLGFLNTALERESEPANRYLIREAQVRELRSGADSDCVSELVSSFVQAVRSDKSLQLSYEQFLDTVQLLGKDRETTALRKAFELTEQSELLRMVAERLLRLEFDDHRTGWGQISYSRLPEDGSQPPQMNIGRMAFRAVGMLILLKLFPFVMRWQLRRTMNRKPKGIQQINYSRPEGSAPEIPQPLKESQRGLLTALAAKPELWQFRTNLWELFGLPASAAGLRQFVADR